MMKKVSIVTISYNQVKFLKKCIDSVINQNYKNIEYIIVDAGSCDGSRDLINSYGDKINKIFEKDNGPADGLNKGFSTASGEIYGFLNSDDYLEPDAISFVVDFFEDNNDCDVLSGSSYIVNEKGKVIRKFYSDQMNLNRFAYQGVILSQPSTFFKKNIFMNCGGFNVNNKSNWDGELFCEMAIRSSKFYKVDKILSSYRLQPSSITSSGAMENEHNLHQYKMFYKIKKRNPFFIDKLLFIFFRLLRKLLNLRDTYQRLRYGPIYNKSGS